MNKILLACFIICLSACQLLKKSELVNNLKKDPITIYADFKFNEGRLIGSKTKTKINILKDSILISARMFLGMELVNIQITNEQIYIDQNFLGKKDTIKLSAIDSSINIKSIRKMIIQSRHKKDTIRYINQHLTCVFTDYKKHGGAFLPEKVVFYNNTDKQNNKNNIIQIEYKSIYFPRE